MTTEKKGPDMNKIGEVLAAMDAEEAAKAADHPEVLAELDDLLDNLSGDSLRILEGSILNEGIRDPIIIWEERNVVVDGHNRLSIAKKHKLAYKTEKKSFKDIDAVRTWMIENQLGRRNLGPDRFTYYIGTLYNKEKQNEPGTVGGVRKPSADGKDTATRIAEKVGVSEKTVRRAGDVALGIDKIGQIKGKLAKTEQLAGKGDYTNSELTEIGKQSPKVAPIMVRKLDEAKAKIKETKKKEVTQAKAAAAAPVKYEVAFCAPDFDALNYSAGSVPRPALKENAIVYLKCEDHQVPEALELMKKWGLDYEGSFIFYGSNSWDGTYSKTMHQFLMIGTKGVMPGPKKGKEAASVQKINGIADDHMVKLIETYHPDVKRLDMRAKKAKGWD